MRGIHAQQVECTCAKILFFDLTYNFREDFQRDKSRYMLFCILFILILTPSIMAITKDELSNIFLNSESSVSDIYIEYDWYNIPEWTIEDINKSSNQNTVFPKDGVRHFKLYLSRRDFILNQEPYENITPDINDPNLSPLNWIVKLEESTTFFNKDNKYFDQFTVKSYDGKIGKTLNIGGLPNSVKVAQISHQKPNITLPLSPIGFSLFRTGVCGETGYYPLSVIFKKSSDLIVLNTEIRKIEDFNTISADLLQQTTKLPVMKIYFSIDHNYTPVLYEYMNGKMVSGTIKIESLQKINERLWLPSSGIITSPSNGERIDAFMNTAPIIANQKKDIDYFDITFPAGTEVYDQINKTKYTVK